MKQIPETYCSVFKGIETHTRAKYSNKGGVSLKKSVLHCKEAVNTFNLQQYKKISSSSQVIVLRLLPLCAVIVSRAFLCSK